MNEHETQRRGRRAVVFAVAAALALLAAPARAGLLSSDDARECGCTKKGNYTWADHLALWSNMVSIVQNVSLNYNQAMAVFEEAHNEWSKSADTNALFEADTETRFRIMADHAIQGFKDWYQKADDFRFRAVSLACVNNEWLKIRDLKDELDRSRQRFLQECADVREQKDRLSRERAKQPRDDESSKRLESVESEMKFLSGRVDSLVAEVRILSERLSSLLEKTQNGDEEGNPSSAMSGNASTNDDGE